MSVSFPPRRILLVWLLVAGWLLTGVLAQAAEPVDAQRAAFKQAYAAAQQGGDGWRGLAGGLRDYPLYPYLPAAALQHDIRQVDRASVEAYLRQYPDWIPAADLRRAFLLELAQRQDWSGFLALYQPGLGDALSCNALQARLAGGAALDFERDLAELWTRPSLPDACDPVLRAAHDQGLLTDARLWTRIDRAADAGQAGTIASLADWLGEPGRRSAQQLALALRDPAAALAAAAGWPDQPRQREAATLALTRLARRQVDDADTAWQQLRSHFAFSEAQRDRILRTLALFHATDFDDGALARLIALPAAAQSEGTREWRVRVALARRDWSAVLAGIDAMPADQQQDGEWRYFRARALAALNRDDEARRLFEAQAGQATFFGFLSADRLDRPYAICPLPPTDDPQREQALLANPGLRRAFELYAVDLPKPARREWARALQDADPTTQRAAVVLANRRGWYDRAVFVLNSGEALRLYELRFPLASQDGLVPQAEQAGVEPAWAYGILRAESAWVSDAQSGADARGLMQLLPSTAALVAKRNGLDWGGGDTLYDPVTNIALGTRYLAQMAARFNGSPWLASAAYNAGPNKVEQWLAARGTLAPDLFVATMPFKETREYVARVMAFSVIYDWRLSGGPVVSLADRMSAIGQPYALPTAATVRRPVDCPPAVAPAAAASAAAATP
ncbi:lytic transglycosylase [Rhodanobacter sp. FW510-R12]|uniref:transglycosylase SLT domain-containing protein n=1 Tax=unclassified Rhodanobacter TaxID=2621553 RepID=UPI0007AA44EC|nr:MULTISPECIES: transglycosylase SLT domain-containing protein [unclassified Rhodanobacter]KZC15982.1 lytic transglycosylase [Rhodanobacter sp. FW104-R8]KZC25442.1 lytic transglycosylase [Rhodanobacter sp. FW510-T8]KZC30754.1 lytic transglycosylase [Rhodanobacter sp. FW510-R10]